MLVRIGFEIIVSCKAPVPMLMALSTHSEFPGPIIGSDKVRSSGPGTITEYLDGFGNRMSRTVASAGLTTYWSDCVATVDGLPDKMPVGAIQHRIEDLPYQTLNFLTASRYCDSDKLGTFAWKQFGNVPEGWERVKAISNFVHGHVTFGYKFGRPDKTASNVMDEKTGVCRDFAHLGVSLCRAMNIPARYVSGYLGDIGVEDSGFDDFCAWFEVFLGGAWHTVDARYNKPQHRPHRHGARPRRGGCRHDHLVRRLRACVVPRLVNGIAGGNFKRRHRCAASDASCAEAEGTELRADQLNSSATLDAAGRPLNRFPACLWKS